jgi:hypothetical protein
MNAKARKTTTKKANEPKPYILSFTAASLRVDLARIMAESFIKLGSWEQTKQFVLATNALQTRSTTTAIRMERELRQRLQTLTQAQIELVAYATLDHRTAMTWLSMLKHSQFVFDFASDLLRSKLETLDPILHPSDYEGFWQSQAVLHPELDKMTPASKAKIRQVLMLMLHEVGLLQTQQKNLTIQALVLPPQVISAIMTDNPRWLAGFLLSDQTIMQI